MGITILRIKNTFKDFYQMIGPFLARRFIDNELGGRIYNDDGMEWFIALEENDVIGFCCVKPKKNSVRFCHAYVIEEYRKKGIYKKLFNARFCAYMGCQISATCNDKSLKMFLDHGFKIMRKRGRYTEVVMEKNKKVENNRLLFDLQRQSVTTREISEEWGAK
jgi:GNAT superfamily N-acetyltransferase